ncbi:mannose-6-phosphate isomerase, class I [Vibrio cyclitrophicus]|uniref:mannose-6-phosphate isomerase, class I n=1 Tax=Vibrio cyclitrophicus TaxID=47951 RepID=UPI000C82DDA1|nr:mannose-6-phosphate isomerase, class I [Vibrio cyclitrophicus]PME46494.1 mannose-6-phosphate isomerase, class I [Vibrio cyclitrophicus]
MIFLLKNPIKDFPWGSRVAIHDYFDIPNPNFEHQAELWMGAHPCDSSLIQLEGDEVALCDAIVANPEFWMGSKFERYESSFPFLMKILAAEEPLSVQVHPSKSAAELGFLAENEKNIPLDSANRNYKDANHKPELVYAITPYLAMNGFREFSQIVANFDAIRLPSINELFQPFKQEPNASTLATFFSSLLSLEGGYKKQAINELLSSIPIQDEKHLMFQASVLVRRFYQLYPEDIGVFSPLFLNIIELKPGEAMFLYAGTPHAYINGMCIEVMANSDNVLRAGLTPKHIDVEELVKNTKFEPIAFENLVLKPENVKRLDCKVYPIPVDDFKFDVLTPKREMTINSASPEILFCLSDCVTILTETDSRTIHKGDSVVLPGVVGQYKVVGRGSLARAYC